MKISLVSFTDNGAKLCSKLEKYLNEEGNNASAYGMKKYAEANKIIPIENGLALWTKENFNKSAALIFVGATGIAVRSIAPYIKDKTADPAVIVIDDGGNFVISLLSGHLGGANELTKEIADFIGGMPVITTATDVNNTLSVDVWAKKNNLFICDMKAAKYIAAALLDKEEVGFKSAFDYEGALPKNIIEKENGKIGINVSLLEKEKTFDTTLNLIPQIVTIGIGCRKNTPFESIESTIMEVLRENNISLNSIRNIASIDLKKNEEGILRFSNKYKLDFITYTAEELNSLEGNFTASKFVSSITGVDNVCERSAVIGSNHGKLLVKKFAENSVTVAIAVMDYKIKF